MTYFVALNTTGGVNYREGMYYYLNSPKVEIETLIVCDEHLKVVDADTALSEEDARFVAWYGEFVWYALLKAGHTTDISQWISLDVWRVASALPRDIERSPEQRRLITETDDALAKQRRAVVKQDLNTVVATYKVLSKSYKATEPNWQEWHTHVKINARGVAIDKHFVKRYASMLEGLTDSYKYYFREIFGTAEPRKLDLLAYVNSFGVVRLSSLNRADIQALLKAKVQLPHDAPTELRAKLSQFEELRYALMCQDITADRTYVKLDNIREEGRLYGAYQFCGTTTGRWTSKGINLHNLAKDGTPEEVSAGRQAVLTPDRDKFEELSRDKGRLWLLRTAFVPTHKDKLLVAFDYRQIECRLLATLTGERWKLDAFTGGLDIYKATASKLFGVAYDDVTAEQRRFGKLAELALGYGGGASVLTRQGVQTGVANRLVSGWHKANAQIVAFWERLHKAYTYTYTEGKDSIVEGLYLHKVKEGVAIRLLSMRTMVVTDEPNKVTGATLTARVVQAMARDILATALCELEQAGYGTVMHTQDEVVVEISDDAYEYQKGVDAVQGAMISAGSVLRGIEVPLAVSMRANKYYF